MSGRVASSSRFAVPIPTAEGADGSRTRSRRAELASDRGPQVVDAEIADAGVASSRFTRQAR